jgi:hypothetical protein
MKRFLATVCATLWVLPSALYAQGLGASQLILTNTSGGGVILQPDPTAPSPPQPLLITPPPVPGAHQVVYTPAWTQNRLAKWTNAAAPVLGNSLISDDGTTVEIGNGNLSITNTGTARELRLYEPFDGTNNYTAFRAQAQALDITYTLPADLMAGTLVTNARILQSDDNGNLSWLSPTALAAATAWTLTGNGITSAWNGLSGNFLGTTNAQPLVIATTSTAPPQPIQFWTNNVERMRITATGNVGIGTAAPALRLAIVDAGVGLDRPAANVLALYTNNTERMRITATGNVGIGTAAPARRLAIVDAGVGLDRPAANVLALYTNNTEQMRITATGNVGIGTNSPTQRLQVHDGNIALTSSGAPRQLQLYATGSVYTALQASGSQSTTITYTLPADLTAGTLVLNGRILQSDNSGNLSWLSPTALAAATAWTLTGNSITGTEFLGTTNAQPLVIRTNNTERMRITATGEVVVQNQDPTGATKVIIRAGANQSGVNLLEWQNNSGDPLGVIRPDGSVVLVYAPPARQAFFAVANPSGVPLIGIGPDPSGWGVGVYDPTPPFGQLRAGMGRVGTEWRMGVGDLAAQNGVLLSWATTGTANEPRIVVANGNLTTPVFLVDREGDVTVRGTTVALPNIPTAAATDDVLRISPTGEVRRSSASGLISGLAWALTGNGITSAWNGSSGNFLGTTNAQPLVIATTSTAPPQPIQFWTNNVERMRITATGEVVVQNQDPTGATKVIIRAGANQSGVNLLEWQNNSGDPLGVIRPDGSVVLVYAPPARQAFFAVANPSGVPLIGIGPDPSGWGVGVYDPTPPFGQLRAGMGRVGTEWRMGVGDLGAQNGVLLSWVTGAPNEPRIVVANGNLTDPVFLVDNEGDVTVKGTTVLLPNIPTAAATDDVLRISPTGEVRRSSASGLISGLVWALTGNGITSAWNGSSGNFLGTTNAQPLVIATTSTAPPQPIQFWTNNVERMRITAAGDVGIGTTSPAHRLQVNGNIYSLKHRSKFIQESDVANSNYSEIILSSWGQGAQWAINAAYTDNGYPPSNMIYKVDPGTYNTGAGLLRFDGNAKRWEFYVAPASTGAGDPVSFTQLSNLSNSSIWFSPTGTSSDFYINSSGKVGIGTTSPAHRLQVNGNIYSLKHRSKFIQESDVANSNYSEIILSSWGQGAQWAINAAYTDNGYPPSNMIYKVDPGTYNTGAGLLRFDGNTKQWEFYVALASTGVGNPVSFTQLSNLSNSSIWFSPTGTSSDFYINSSGKVGIGTTAPSHKLHIEGGNLRINSATDYNLITLSSPSWDPTAFVISARDNSLAYSNTIPLSIQASRISLLGGNVGIGTTAPSHKLHIEGGNLRINSATDYNLITLSSPSWDPTAFVISARDNSLAYSNTIPLSIQASRISLLGGNVGIGTTAPAARLDVNGTVAFSATATITGANPTIPNGVVVVEINGCSGTVTLPSGTQGQLLFIRRYNSSASLTLPGVEPNGSDFSSSANFHAILMYIGGAWRLMSVR